MNELEGMRRELEHLVNRMREAQDDPNLRSYELDTALIRAESALEWLERAKSQDGT